MRIAELQGLGGPAPDDTGEEEFCRLLVTVDGRVHEEWNSGRIHDARLIEDAMYWPLLDPSWLTAHEPVRALGPRVAAGRNGFAVEAIGAGGPAGMLLPGANRCVGVLDDEFAVLLRCEAWLDDELLMVEEMTEVVFDEPFDDELSGASG